MRVVGSGEAVSLVSLGLGEPKLVDPDGASLGSQTRGFFLERSRSVAGWGEFGVIDPGFLCLEPPSLVGP